MQVDYPRPSPSFARDQTECSGRVCHALQCSRHICEEGACCRQDCHKELAQLMLHMVRAGQLDTARDIIMVTLVSK